MGIAGIASLWAAYLLCVPGISATEAVPGGGEEPSVRPVVLERWEHLWGISLNDNGSVAFVVGRRGVPSAVRLAQGDKITTVVRVGDPVPDDPSLLFHSIYPLSKLNDRNEFAFIAELLACSDRSMYRECLRKNVRTEGVFLYSNDRLRRIAGPADTVEGFGSLDKVAYWTVAINNLGEVAAGASAWRNRGVLPTRSLILWRNGLLRKIVCDGDPLPAPLSDQTFHLETYYSSALTDAGDVVFEAWCEKGRGLFRFDGKRTSKIVLRGDPSPAGPAMSSIDWIDVNSRGDATFLADWEGVTGALLMSTLEGAVSTVALPGNPLPGGGRFDSLQLQARALSAERVFVFGDGGSGRGLYRSTQGRLEKFVGDGDSAAPFSPSSFVFDFELNSDIRLVPGGPNTLAFSTSFSSQTSWSALFLQEGSTRSMLARMGDPAPGTQGLRFANMQFDHLTVNQLNEVAFRGYLCCGAYREGIFIAGPPRLTFRNGDFDESGEGELPAGWSRISGTGDAAYAARYDSAGSDSWTGSSTMRLHVSPSGGTVAVQSEPVAVTPGTEYLITWRMRFHFTSANQTARFSVVQYNSDGNTVGSHSVEGRVGDNFWSWQPKVLRVRVADKAATVRMRIELSSDRDCFLDVDTLR